MDKDPREETSPEESQDETTDRDEKKQDDAVEETFPASDPPAW
jgi:hypothetical protein